MSDIPETAVAVPNAINGISIKAVPNLAVRERARILDSEGEDLPLHEKLNQKLAAFTTGILQNVYENTGGDESGFYTLNRYTLGTNGRTEFNSPRVNGQPGKPQKELTGIILHHQGTRRFYPEQFGRSSENRRNIPSCMSLDVNRNRFNAQGFPDMGVGDPGGNCSECQRNFFHPQRGPDCQERHQLYMLINDEPRPIQIDFSASTSAERIQRYMQDLGYLGVAYWQLVHKITLVPTQTTGGFDVAAFNAEPIGVIASEDPSVIEGLKAYREMCRNSLVNFARSVQQEAVNRRALLTIEGDVAPIQTANSNMPPPPSMRGQGQQISQEARYNPNPRPAPVYAQPGDEMPLPVQEQQAPWGQPAATQSVVVVEGQVQAQDPVVMIEIYDPDTGETYLVPRGQQVPVDPESGSMVPPMPPARQQQEF